MNANKIFLVGLPGSGKSYFGKRLSKHLEIPFLDLDEFIENQEGSTIAEIFEHQGEEHFRLIESQALKQVINEKDQVILATGGGTPCFHNGIDFMLAQGAVVHLEIDDEELVERLSRSDDRPLIQENPQRTIKDLREKRDAIYRKGHLTISHRDIGLLLNDLSK